MSRTTRDYGAPVAAFLAENRRLLVFLVLFLCGVAGGCLVFLAAHDMLTGDLALILRVRPVEKGLAGLAVWALYLWYMVSAGWRQIIGQGNLEFLNMQLVSVVVTLAMAYIYLRMLSNTLKDAGARSRGERIEGSYIAALCRGFLRSARFCLSQYGRTFRASSPLIKISMVIPFFVMGAAQFLQRQFVKGLLFLAIQGAYIA